MPDQDSIVDVVSKYFPLKKVGDRYQAICPFHQETKPSFYVDPAKQTYYCYGCGATGGAKEFEQRMAGK